MDKLFSIENFPAVIKSLMFLDIELVRFTKFRLFRVLVLSSLSFYAMVRMMQENKFSFTKIHDSVICLVCLYLDVLIENNKNNWCHLLKTIMEPASSFASRSQLNHQNNFLKVTKACGKCAVVFVVMFTLIYGLAPVFTFYFTDYKGLDTPLLWLQTANSTTLASVLAALAPCLVFFFVTSLLISWGLSVLFAALKIKLWVNLMLDELENLDELAEQRFEQKLMKMNENYTLPMCLDFFETRMMLMDDFLGFEPEPNTIWKPCKLFNRYGKSDCCRKEQEEKIFEKCIEEILNSVIMQHQKIIEFRSLVDKTYRTFFIVLIPAIVIATAMVIPKLDLDLKKRSLPLAFPTLIEGIGVIVVVGALNAAGQIFVDQSKRLRMGLYFCNWTDKSMSFRRSLIVMQTVANRDLRITVGGLYELRLETFYSILWSIYRYSKLGQDIKTRFG